MSQPWGDWLLQLLRPKISSALHKWSLCHRHGCLSLWQGLKLKQPLALTPALPAMPGPSPTKGCKCNSFSSREARESAGELLRGTAAARPCYLPRHVCEGSCQGTWFTVWGWIPLALQVAWQWRKAPPHPGRDGQSRGPDSEGLNQ